MRCSSRRVSSVISSRSRSCARVLRMARPRSWPTSRAAAALALGPARLARTAGDQHHAERLRARRRSAPAPARRCRGRRGGGRGRRRWASSSRSSPHTRPGSAMTTVCSRQARRAASAAATISRPAAGRGESGSMSGGGSVWTSTARSSARKPSARSFLRLGQQLAVAEPPGRGPHHLLGGGGEPDLLAQLLALDRGQHRPEHQRAGPRRAGRSASGPGRRPELGSSRYIRARSWPRSSTMRATRTSSARHWSGAPVSSMSGIQQYALQLLDRLGRQPLLRDERPLAVLRAEAERQRHRREGRRAAQHLVVGARRCRRSRRTRACRRGAAPRSRRSPKSVRCRASSAIRRSALRAPS